MSNPPAGWYPDPTGQPNTIRWWNGTQWTNRTEQEPADEAGSTAKSTETTTTEPNHSSGTPSSTAYATGAAVASGAVQAGGSEQRTVAVQSSGGERGGDEQGHADDGLTAFERARATWGAPAIAPAPPEHWTQREVPDEPLEDEPARAPQQNQPNGWKLTLAPNPVDTVESSDADHGEQGWGGKAGRAEAKGQQSWGEQPGEDQVQRPQRWSDQQTGGEPTQTQPAWGVQPGEEQAPSQQHWGAQSDQEQAQGQQGWGGQPGQAEAKSQQAWGEQQAGGEADQAPQGWGGQSDHGQRAWGAGAGHDEDQSAGSWGHEQASTNPWQSAVEQQAPTNGFDGVDQQGSGAAWNGGGEQSTGDAWGGAQQNSGDGWSGGQQDSGGVPSGGQQTATAAWGGDPQNTGDAWRGGQQTVGQVWGGGEQAWQGGEGEDGGRVGNGKQKNSGGASGAKLPLMIGGAVALVMLIVAAIFLITNPGDDKQADPDTTTSPTGGQPSTQPTGASSTKPGQSKNPKLHEGDGRISSDAISFPRRQPPWSDRKRLVEQLHNSSGQYVVLQEKFDGRNNWYADIFVGALGTESGFNGDPKATALSLSVQLRGSMYGDIPVTFKTVADGAVMRSDKSGWFVQQTVTANSTKLTARVLTLTVAVFDLGDGTAVAYISDIPTNRPDLRTAESQAYKGINVG